MTIEPTESETQKAILEYLSLKRYLCWRNNSGGFRDKRDHYYQFGKVGSGDILGLTRDGKFFSIEVKRRGKKPTDHQLKFMQDVKSSNGFAVLAYSVDDVMASGL